MSKDEFQKLIRQEVIAVVRTELVKIVKPLVQEAVAGALANLLAEGIVKGAPAKQTIMTPNVPQARQMASQAPRQNAPTRALDANARRRFAEQHGFESIEPIGMGVQPRSGNVVNDILAETAMQMHTNGPVHVDSVLDTVGDMEGMIAPEAVEAITRDYSDLMKAMNRRGKING